jgi:hypothetical protein
VCYGEVNACNDFGSRINFVEGFAVFDFGFNIFYSVFRVKDCSEKPTAAGGKASGRRGLVTESLAPFSTKGGNALSQLAVCSWQFAVPRGHWKQPFCNELKNRKTYEIYFLQILTV